MNPALAEVLELLDLEQLEVNLFRGQSQDFGSGNVFGGQVLGQALAAASRTLREDRGEAHSLHAYFLRPGNMKLPIVYEVERIRDGRSFDTRLVQAIQNGAAILNMSVSYHVREDGLEHQLPMPDIPGPEDLLNEVQLRDESGLADKLPEEMKHRFLRARPIETRPVAQHAMLSRERREPFNYYWLKADCGDDKLPDGPLVHQSLLAYASDMGLLSTSMNAHGINYMTGGIQAASLDHSMWFHRSFRMDEWLLYATDSPTTGGSRGFNRGAVYTRDGVLVCSTAQEGLLRVRKSKAGFSD